VNGDKDVIKNDEVDLREVFMVLWNRKVFIILAVFVVTLLTAGLTVLTPPEYSSTAKIMVDGNEEMHRDMLLSSQIMDRVKEKTGSGVKEETEFSVERVDNTSILNIITSGRRPEVLAEAADIWVNSYLIYKTERQISRNKEDLDVIKDEIEGYEEEIANHSPAITLSKSLVDDAVLMHFSENDIWEKIKDNVVVEQRINPVYRDLKNSIVKSRESKRALENRIKRLQEIHTLLKEADAREVLSAGIKIDDVQLNSYAGNPRRMSRNLARNIILALFGSFFAAVVLSFVLEFIKGALETERNN